MRWRFGAVILALASVSLAAGQKRQPTVDWVFSDAAEQLTSMPEYAWTSAAEVLLVDSRRPETERTLERLNAGSGARTPAVDRARALASLESTLGGKDLPKGVPWPESLDRKGHKGAYLFAGDVFVLDIAASRFDRITRTPDAESIVRLSPDGRSVSYVRGHDLYVADIATKAETRLTTDGAATVLNGSLSWVYW